MSFPKKPEVMPVRPEFSSGPCAKRPGWSIKKIETIMLLGRSHRAVEPKKQLKEVIELTKKIAKIPHDFKVAIVPASNTGAYEMAMWNMLGKNPVDVFAWESFGFGWATDATTELKLQQCRVMSAEYGLLPELDLVREDADICFAWNGTTSGVRVPNANWIPKERKGLVLCDATSAIFSQDLDWTKLDVTTFSWQKSLGSEAAHGMLVLSPNAVERLENFVPERPLPKIFRLTKNGKLVDGIFNGETINTPSMLCVADALDALRWVDEIGGINKTIERSDANFVILQSWLDNQQWIENLVSNELNRSNSSVCLKLIAAEFLEMDSNEQRSFIKKMVNLLETEGAAFDIEGHRDAPPGLRIWCGPTVEAQDISDLLPWLKWAFETVLARNEFSS